MIKALQHHPAFTHTQDLLDLCKPLTLFDITTFVHVRVDQQGGVSGLCTNPDFLTNYVEQGYHNADIHVRKNNAQLGNYLMWDMMECFSETEKMVADAAILFDYRHNFTIIKNSAIHNDYYHFGTHLIEPSINQWHINHLDILHAFIDYFNAKVSNSRELSSAYNFVLPTLDEAAHCSITLNNTQEQRLDFLKAINFQEEIILPKRQVECMKLLIQGLSAKEIARALHLSHRTVEDHLLALKNTLKAKNKAELIAKGLKLENIPI